MAAKTIRHWLIQQWRRSCEIVSGGRGRPPSRPESESDFLDKWEGRRAADRIRARHQRMMFPMSFRFFPKYLLTRNNQFGTF
jgi:hypothetical protein